VTIHNFTKSPLAVRGVVLDALMLRQGPVRIESFAKEASSAVWETGEAAAAIVGADGGLLLGIEGGGRYELFAPEADHCRLVRTEEKVLQVKEVWHQPATFVLPFTGPLDACLARGYADFRIAARRMKKWEQEQAAAARAGHETN
jgi:hypothetical protein